LGIEIAASGGFTRPAARCCGSGGVVMNAASPGPPVMRSQTTSRDLSCIVTVKRWRSDSADAGFALRML
jgi:hypothetical protein